jgi:hypothetical protein
VKIVGVTIVRNAISLDLPIEAAVRSILPLVDEVVAVVGDSSDATREQIATIAPGRLHVVDTAWQMEGRPGGSVLAEQTQRGLEEAARRGADWCFYIQADEVIHEHDYDTIRTTLAAADPRPEVEGLLFDYLHFFGDYLTVATSRNFYRREVRVVRSGIDVRSYRDAQGFRVGSRLRRIRATPSGARVYHYGWARSVEHARKKTAVLETIFGGRAAEERPFEYGRFPGLRRFTGHHPAPVRAWIAARPRHFDWEALPVRWTARLARYAVSDAIEQLTGWRVGEFRNYRVVR